MTQPYQREYAAGYLAARRGADIYSAPPHYSPEAAKAWESGWVSHEFDKEPNTPRRKSA